LSNCTVAIVGATGAIGHALSLFCAERAAELILIGNPRGAEASVRKLRDVAEDCRRHIAFLAGTGRAFSPGGVADRLARRRTTEPAPGSDADTGMTITTDIDRHLPRADIVPDGNQRRAAVHRVTPPAQRRHVCDVSRPFNIARDLIDQRPDLRIVSGGLVEAPAASILSHVEERDRQNVLMACAAETIVLTLSGHRSERLCGRLEIKTVEEVGRLADHLGFSVISK